MSGPGPGDTDAIFDPNMTFITDGGVSVRFGDIVIYHDAAGDFPALVLALNAGAKTATLQEFNLSAPIAPLTGISLGSTTGQWEPRQAKF